MAKDRGRDQERTPQTWLLVATENAHLSMISLARLIHLVAMGVAEEEKGTIVAGGIERMTMAVMQDHRRGDGSGRGLDRGRRGGKGRGGGPGVRRGMMETMVLGTRWMIGIGGVIEMEGTVATETEGAGIAGMGGRRSGGGIDCHRWIARWSRFSQIFVIFCSSMLSGQVIVRELFD